MPKVAKTKLYVAPDSTHGKIWIDEEDMLERFDEYLHSERCLGHTKVQTIIDKDTLQPQDIVVASPRSPTIKSFCLYCGTSPQAWYQNYANNPDFENAVAIITAFCESETRGLFEDGAISPSLAALWMGGYGYSTKQEQDIKGGVPVVIQDDLGE